MCTCVFVYVWVWWWSFYFYYQVIKFIKIEALELLVFSIFLLSLANTSEIIYFNQYSLILVFFSLCSYILILTFVNIIDIFLDITGTPYIFLRCENFGFKNSAEIFSFFIMNCGFTNAAYIPQCLAI